MLQSLLDVPVLGQILSASSTIAGWAVDTSVQNVTAIQTLGKNILTSFGL